MVSVRAANVYKINNYALYSRATRRIVPAILTALLISNVTVFIVALIFFDFSLGIAFCIYGLAPLLIAIFSFIQFVQRILRVLTAVEVVATGTLLSCGWVVYGCIGMYLGFNNDFYNPWMWFAIPGFFLNVVYLSFGAAAVETHRQRKAREANANAYKIENEYVAAVVRPAPENRYSTKPPSYRISEETIMPPAEKGEVV